jgi:hypothetical protein
MAKYTATLNNKPITFFKELKDKIIEIELLEKVVEAWATLAEHGATSKTEDTRTQAVVQGSICNEKLIELKEKLAVTVHLKPDLSEEQVKLQNIIANFTSFTHSVCKEFPDRTAHVHLRCQINDLYNALHALLDDLKRKK